MKKTLIIIGICTFALTLIVNFWYLYILFFAPEKNVNNAFYVDLQTSEDGSVVKPIIEFNYYTNKNKNGFEMFEIKLNSLSDQNKTTISSKGFQYISKDVNGFVDYAYHYNNAVKGEKIKHVGGWYNAKDYYSYWGSFSPGVNGTSYCYTVDNISGISYYSTNEITIDDFFVIEIGNEVYGMKFKGLNTPMNDLSHVADFEDGYDFNVLWGVQNYASYYSYFDVHYLSFLLKKSCGTLKYGTNNMIVFDFADLFDYYEYKGDGVFDEMPMEDSTKVVNHVKNYYAISIKISEDGAKSSSDSLFGLLHASPNYLVENSVEDNYFIGRSIVDVNTNNFKLIDNVDGTYDLILDDSFLSKYSNYKDVIKLNVYIDYEEFLKHNINVNAPNEKTYCGFQLYNEILNGFSIDVGGGENV